jgi:hypothetical protein
MGDAGIATQASPQGTVVEGCTAVQRFGNQSESLRLSKTPQQFPRGSARFADTKT